MNINEHKGIKMNTKQCNKCNQTKATTAFSKNKTNADGLATDCRECRAAEYAANKGQIAAKKAAYHQDNKLKITRQKRVYRANIKGINLSYSDWFWSVDGICPVSGEDLNLTTDAGVGKGSFGPVMWSTEANNWTQNNTYVLAPKYTKVFGTLSNEELVDFSLWVLNDIRALYQSPRLVEDKKVFRGWFDVAKRRANVKGVPFELDLFSLVVPQLCPVLGIELKRGTDGKPSHTSPSLDRVVPAKGYTKDNTNVISHKANIAKSNLTVDELYQLAHWITNIALAEQTTTRIRSLHDDISNPIPAQSAG
jgi:hypothetical protein